MQFSEDELRALAAVLMFAEPMIKASIVDVKERPSAELEYDTVMFGVPDGKGVMLYRAAVRNWVDPNGLKALKVKAQDMLALVGESAGAA
jgi:hypothetical protein